MRKPGYYAAKHKGKLGEEIIQVGRGTGGDQLVYRMGILGVTSEDVFEWIGETPIQVEKMPARLLANHYYVVRPHGEKPLIARYDSRIGLFCTTESLVDKEIYVQRYSANAVEIISGPFTVEQLAKLSPAE